MFIRMLLLMLALLPMANVQAGLWDTISGYFGGNTLAPPPTIKILIAHDEPGVVLEVKGKYKLFDPRTGEHISTRFVGKRKYLQSTHDGIKWGEEFPGVHQLLIVPDEASTVTIVDDHEYQGTLAIYDVGGTISIVNDALVEEFLSSSLNSIYNNPMPEEALAAIAIAARTTAYYQAAHPRSQYWAVDGRSYGYQGHPETQPTTGIEQALTATRFMSMGRRATGAQTLTPFIAEWKAVDPVRSGIVAGTSLLTISDVENMARSGDHAAQILTKAFPGAVIEYKRFASK